MHCIKTKNGGYALVGDVVTITISNMEKKGMSEGRIKFNDIVTLEDLPGVYK